MKIALFGFGNVGKRLANLFAEAGHEVLVCHKEPSTGDAGFRFATFERGASEAEVVVLAIPFVAAKEVLAPLAATLAGKIVVDCTNPLNADWSPIALGAENSAAEEIARVVPGAHVVKAFNTIFADVMSRDKQVRGGRRISAFVASDHAPSRDRILALAEGAGFESVNAGPLRSARYLEAIAHLNIELAVGQGGGTDAAFLFDRARR